MSKISIDDCVNIIITNQDVLPVYEQFVAMFSESKLYKEEIETYEIIYNLTHNPDLLLKIADIFNNSLKSPSNALNIYEKYLYNVMPDFYYKYNDVLKKCGKTQLNGHDFVSGSDVFNFVDRYIALINLMIYLLGKKDYDKILVISKKLKIFKSRFEEFKLDKPGQDNLLLGNIKRAECDLSKKLAGVKHNNDINYFAISLDEDNDKAYLNIVEDLICNGMGYDALKFFNEKYAVKFDTVKQASPIDVCWFISDKYKREKDYYNCVIFQQKAVSMEPRYEC